MTQVPRVQIETAEELYNQYFAQNKPVIITNFQDSWADPAVFTKAGLTERVRICICVCVVCVCVRCVCAYVYMNMCDPHSFTCTIEDVCVLYGMFSHTIHHHLLLYQ